MLPDTPISTRISRIVIAAVAFGITTSVGLFLISDFRQSIKAETLRYQSAAYAFAAASSEAVAQSDPRKVLEVLRGVRSLPEIVYVAALDAKGGVIAEIGAGARLVGSRSLSLIPTAIEVSAEVRRAGEVVGAITMQAEANGLWDRYLTAFLYSSVLGIALVIATSFLARVQVGKVVRPLRSLADQFVDIGQRSDLTRRLQKERNDEVGILVEAFNEMFGHIDDRDRLLQRHRETLEETVDQRTSELRLAKDEADTANAAKSTFLATMSHEIRTPMNGMMVMAEMLAAAPLSPRHQRYAEIITRSGKNLVHIINDILDFSKIESGRIELEEIEFSIDALVEDVVCLFAEKAREKGLSVSIYVAPDVPIRVIGDPVRLTQIISNLVNNGLKFTERGGLAITVEMSSEVGLIDLAVEDSGIGISKDQISRIFTRFAQADSSITRKFGGTGLGLSISKQLAELMAGHIRVESELGCGSRFIASVSLRTVTPALPWIASRPLSTVLVDNDHMSRQPLARALADRGVEIIEDLNAISDAILLKGDDFPVEMVQMATPIVLLRPFAAPTAALPNGRIAALELSMPLSRQLLDKLCQALEQDKLADLDSRSSSDAPQRILDLSHLKVLAVDDVAVNREVLGEALRTFNIECDLADSGPGAITQVRNKSYDLIFMDCSMPEMDGFEAAREIRRIEREDQRPPSRVVALTGHIMGRENGEWKEAGMDCYLSKPFNITQLSSLFRELQVVDQPPNGRNLPAREEDNLSPDELLSGETLEMFESIKMATGTDVRTKVFAMFIHEALPAYYLAADEIARSGKESKRLIHALKSNCSSAGAHRAMSLAQEIETILAAGGAPPQESLGRLHSVLEATIAAMRTSETAEVGMTA